MKKSMIGLLALGLACAASAEMGVANIKGTAADSKLAGTVAFQDTRDGLKIVAKLTGLPPGDHGFHIHQFGSCDDAGKAAGGHYNPKNVNHGLVMKDGMRHAHAGDMGNITADADGNAVLEATLKKEKLSDGKYTVGGRAVIVHEKKDDFSQPTGNAGGRIGCGVIVVSAQ